LNGTVTVRGQERATLLYRPLFAANDRSVQQGHCRHELGRLGSKKRTGILMTPEKSQNVQDVFLNHVLKNNTPVTIFLVNGIRLQGIITWFDKFCVVLQRDAHSQLVYKQEISTVMPGQPIQLFEPSKEIAES
jgi:host factor-I protein